MTLIASFGEVGALFRGFAATSPPWPLPRSRPGCGGRVLPLRRYLLDGLILDLAHRLVGRRLPRVASRLSISRRLRVNARCLLKSSDFADLLVLRRLGDDHVDRKVNELIALGLPGDMCGCWPSSSLPRVTIALVDLHAVNLGDERGRPGCANRQARGQNAARQAVSGGHRGQAQARAGRIVLGTRWS